MAKKQEKDLSGKYRWKHGHLYENDGKSYRPGDTVELSHEFAKAYLASGQCEPLDAATKAAVKQALAERADDAEEPGDVDDDLEDLEEADEEA